MKLTIGFSPCPNDTFIFDALVNKKIDAGNLEFDLVLEDVQTLNEMAIDGKLDVTKISYGSLPLISDKYVLLSSGSALGKGVGPLLIAPFELPDNIKQNVQSLIRESLEYSYKNKNGLSDFVKDNAQEMSIEVMKMHIDLYVNNFSLDLGDDGRKAVRKFLQVHSSINKLPFDSERIFL